MKLWKIQEMNFICKKCLIEYSSMKCPSEYSSVKGPEIIFLSADMIALICMWYSTYIVPVIVLHNSLPSSYDNFISHNVMNTDFYKNHYELSAFVFWGCKNLIFIHNVMNLYYAIRFLWTCWHILWDFLFCFGSFRIN